jgi:hypothetical protein
MALMAWMAAAEVEATVLAPVVAALGVLMVSVFF